MRLHHPTITLLHLNAGFVPTIRPWVVPPSDRGLFHPSLGPSTRTFRSLMRLYIPPPEHFAPPPDFVFRSPDLVTPPPDVGAPSLLHQRLLNSYTRAFRFSIRLLGSSIRRISSSILQFHSHIRPARSLIRHFIGLYSTIGFLHPPGSSIRLLTLPPKLFALPTNFCNPLHELLARPRDSSTPPPDQFAPPPDFGIRSPEHVAPPPDFWAPTPEHFAPPPGF